MIMCFENELCYIFWIALYNNLWRFKETWTIKKKKELVENKDVNVYTMNYFLKESK